MAKIFGPIAKILLKLGISADVVTIVGTIGVIVAALWAFPTNHLAAGSLIIGFFVFADSLDGTMARLSGQSGPWGAFLDSTLDRLADAAIFVGLAWYFLAHGQERWATLGVIASVSCLVFGMLVSYARARAEGLGMTANVGIAERPERLLISLLAACVAGFTSNDGVLMFALMFLALASIITLVQRIAVVRQQGMALQEVQEGEGN
ncbi:CDP-alcohol phosphatidyltransferase family protein [Jonesiaceae bacterium BS-20]|uniref:Phosphatidylinositol phosphate synthase n=1 Tax=Jonesiaceae bacterium BS-20 TaxID=3120821 RepID=A0AAU7E1G7_9MICO